MKPTHKLRGRWAGVFKRWAPAVLYMMLIWLGSAVPSNSRLMPDVGITGADKVVHFAEFMVLGILLSLPLVHRTSFRPALWVWGICVCWGALDELHQVYVPGREPDVLDLCADALGASFGIAATRYLGTRRRTGSVNT